MRSALILAAVAGVATANPIAPRDTAAQDGIDLSVFDAAPVPTKLGPDVGASSEPPTYDKAQAQAEAAQDAVANPVTPVIAARSVLEARVGTCTGAKQEPDGYGPVPPTDDYDTFMKWSYLDQIAANASTTQAIPQGYALSFTGLKGSVEGNGYMGLYTLKSYNPIQCQQYCDSAPACYGFNLFMERNPKFTPGDTCQNPDSITNYKCTLWGTQVPASTATNVGQWRNQFHVGISGSNGYSKLAAPPANTGFDGPTEFGGAIQAPNSYMGSKFYAGPFDPSQCAAACQATTKYDHDHPRSDGTYDACNFFNAYVLSKNNDPQGTYCSMYTKAWTKNYSTNYGQYRGNDYYSVSQSYGYTLTVQDSGTVAPKSSN